MAASPSVLSFFLAPGAAAWLAAAVGALTAAALLDQAARVRLALQQARCARVQPFRRPLARARAQVLVLGDSTGVGLGADTPGDTVAGLLAAHWPDVAVHNLSCIGHRLADVQALADELTCDLAARQVRMDLVLLHVGGNDVLRARDVDALQHQAQALLRTLRAVAPDVVWLGPADVGVAPLFRWPWRWWLSQRARRAAQAFQRACAAEGARFIGFHEPAHSRRFAAEPQRWFAADGVHPSSAAYRYCFAWMQRSGALSRLAGRAVESA